MLKIILLSVCILPAFVLAMIAMASGGDYSAYIRNEKLPVILKGFAGNIIRDGVFTDPDHTMDLSFFRVLRWKFSTNPQAEEKKKDPFTLNIIPSPEIFDMKKDMIVWLGHASFLVRIDGKTFLIDPVLADLPLNKRLCGLPVQTGDVKNIDYILVSHSHLDHLDSTTIKNGDFKNSRALIPLGMTKTIKNFNDSIVSEEAGWFQKYSTEEPEVYFLPARHWSRRSIFDFNETLWGSFIIKGKKKTIYFAGDSAYGTHFSQIAQIFRKIDIALMPVGAYKPAYIMKKNHMTPEEAVQASNDLGARQFIPMHYGTFDLSDEPPGEPLRFIREINDRKKLKARLKELNPGEIMYL